MKFDIGWRDLLWAAFGPAAPRAALVEAGEIATRLWSSRPLVLGLSARTLFDAVLFELDLKPGASIIVSGINIQGMAEIAVAHGLNIVAVDVDPATLAPPQGELLRAQAASGASLCLVAQLFGSASPMLDAAELRRRGVLVIEDAAQAFGGAPYAGDPEADVTLFSFGPIKRSTALGGGVVVMRGADLAGRVQRRLLDRPRLSDAWFRRRALKYLMFKLLTAPAPYALVTKGLKLLRLDVDAVIGGAARGFAGASLLSNIRRLPPARMMALLGRRLAQAHRADTRPEVCERFLGALPPGVARVGNQVARHQYWLLPLRSAEPLRAISILASAGFDATRGATSLRALEPTATPAARDLLAEVVYLPNPAHLPKRASKRLVRVISELHDAGLIA